MFDPIIIIGIGEMGGVFARGLLRLGYPIYPVTRAINMAEVAKQIPKPTAVLVAVAENDLHPILTDLPSVWHKQVILLQNELLPQDWQNYQLNPTVISVWFEKKPGQEFKVIVPSPIYGEQAQLIADALATLGIDTKIVTDTQDLLQELVLKNVYILSSNIAGLVVGGTVGELWENHQDLTHEIAHEVIDIQESLVKQILDRDQLMQGLLSTFNGDPNHKCMGRSAPGRLQRALKLADQHDLEVSKLRQIQAQLR